MNKFLLTLSALTITSSTMAVQKNDNCSTHQMYFPYIWELEDCSPPPKKTKDCSWFDVSCI